MARPLPSSGSIKPLSASRQLAFHQLLTVARKTWLSDALSAALHEIDPAILKAQLMTFVPLMYKRFLQRREFEMSMFFRRQLCSSPDRRSSATIACSLESRKRPSMPPAVD